jgi:hypothetical protein
MLVAWLAIQFLKLLRWLLAAAVIIGLWPVSAAAGLGYLAAWLRGWPPARLYRIAAWTLPYVVAYLFTAALQAHHRWQNLALAPVRAWRAGSLDLLHGRVLPGLYTALPPAFPIGMLIAGAAWAWWCALVTSGLAGMTEFAPVIHDVRQWRRQARTARAAIRAPGLYPLATRDGGVPVGAVIRTVGHRDRQVLTLPAGLFSRHQVVIGASGSGKTNLMFRLTAGWYAATLAAYEKDHARWEKAARRGGPGNGKRRDSGRPLVVILDCKGGLDARAKASRIRRVLLAAGAADVRRFPDHATVSIWTGMEPRALAVFLHQVIEHGTGSAAFYADMSQAIVSLAVLAPGGPPAGAEDFLARLDEAWLTGAYAGGTRAQRAAIRGAVRYLPEIQARYQVLLARLGPEFDGPGKLAGADAWYVILEGTREPSVAAAQAMAWAEMVAHAATDPDGEPRQILLVADDYSAVSARVPLSNLYERGRSLGLAVIVSAQSWHGLGATEDERYRIAATADGGIWLLKTPFPERVVEFAGTIRLLESARKLIGAAFGDEGTSRIQHAWTVDPNRIRSLRTGQACYIRDGGATYIQVARARPSPVRWPVPAARTPARPVIIPPARLAPTAPQDPGGGSKDQEGTEREARPGTVSGQVLDDVLGPDPGTGKEARS